MKKSSDNLEHDKPTFFCKDSTKTSKNVSALAVQKNHLIILYCIIDGL